MQSSHISEKKTLIHERALRREAMARVRDRLRESPQLHYLFFELTDGCNLRCRHCGSSCGDREASYLDTEKVKETISAAAALEPRVHIVLTGGEPLLHPKFEEIVRHLARERIFWSLVTNAVLLTPDTASLLKKCGIYSVSVSLDGDESEHDLLRQSPRAFMGALRGMELLKKHGIKLQITTVLTKRTISQLSRIEEIIKSTGAISWKLVNVEPIGRALSEEDLLLDREDIFRLFDFIREKRKSGAVKDDLDITYGCSHFLPLLYEEEVRTTPFICGAGIMIAGIRSNGDISACLDIERRPELVQGNIYRDSFVSVWKNRFEYFRSDRTEASELCRSCPLRYECGGDSTHTWDFDRNMPRVCFLHEDTDRI